MLCVGVLSERAGLPWDGGQQLPSSHSPNPESETRLSLVPWHPLRLASFHEGAGVSKAHSGGDPLGSLLQVSAYTSMVDAEAQEDYSRILRSMCQKLRSVHYNGSYFDRGAEAGGRLCTTEGWFSCQDSSERPRSRPCPWPLQGPFDLDSCSSKHSINPYGNRESRILFSTWNLDHIIEKKRTIVPTLAEAVQEQAGREVDWEYFYSLLFTSQNLKLVHIACHKKTTHKLQCDRSRIYRARTGPGKHPPARKRR
ncbi:DNA fragmentation factor subunit beta isoform X8 [Nannospalax galili]|uniref:DNA fragmentation factor subunit beta isoform X8 n=1 Tax=Nannospalax galili TaxID=1026970 RepID=UPI00111C7B95|nr:DNA fragmentation factor subunit beta isoform X8 [Nannospalax galili]